MAPVHDMQRTTNESDRDFVARTFGLSPEETSQLDGHLPLAAAIAEECVTLLRRTPHEGELDADVFRQWLVNGRIRLDGQTYAPLAAITNPRLGDLLLDDLRQANQRR